MNIKLTLEELSRAKELAHEVKGKKYTYSLCNGLFKVAGISSYFNVTIQPFAHIESGFWLWEYSSLDYHLTEDFDPNKRCWAVSMKELTPVDLRPKKLREDIRKCLGE